jgi:hypothetical protein
MKKVRFALGIIMISASFSACVKKAYDNPPDVSYLDPNLPVNATIKNLVNSAFATLPTIGSSRILGDTTISGIVIGDDRSGNIYKQIVIEDTSRGGMIILIDRTNLYNDYPAGRKIYIKAKGLYLANYKGLPEIAYSVDAAGNTSGIPSTLLNNFLVKGSYPNTIQPTVLSIADLIHNPYPYLNTLITLTHMQFDAASAGVAYSSISVSTNRTVVGTDSASCTALGSLVMYNSSYSTFQPAITPTGNGSLTGIVSIYVSTPQFVLRDTTDVQFTNPRCN